MFLVPFLAGICWVCCFLWNRQTVCRNCFFGYLHFLFWLKCINCYKGAVDRNDGQGNEFLSIGVKHP